MTGGRRRRKSTRTASHKPYSSLVQALRIRMRKRYTLEPNTLLRHLVVHLSELCQFWSYSTSHECASNICLRKPLGEAVQSRATGRHNAIYKYRISLRTLTSRYLAVHAVGGESVAEVDVAAKHAHGDLAP